MQEDTDSCVWLEPSAVEVRRDDVTAGVLDTLGYIHIAEEAGDDGCTFGCLQWFSPVPQ